MRQARWLLRERDEFLAERASARPTTLLEEVRAQAERMVQRTEIVRQANQVAQRILDDAREEARRLRHEAEDFCDQKLAGFEIVLDRTMKTVQSGREKLQATAAAARAEPGGRRAPARRRRAEDRVLRPGRRAEERRHARPTPSSSTWPRCAACAGTRRHEVRGAVDPTG